MMKVGIVGMPNAGKSSLFNALSQAGARGRQLPVHDDRAERRGGAACTTSGSTRSRRRSAPRTSCPTRSSSTTSPGSWPARTRARGSATSSWPTSARPTRCCTSCARTTTTTSIHPDGRVDPAADIETIETELIYADLEQAERRHARVVREARGGRPRAVAEEAWLRDVIEALQSGRAGAHRAGAGRTRRTRLRNLVAADRQAGAVRGQRRRGRRRGAGGRGRPRRSARAPRRSRSPRGSRPSSSELDDEEAASMREELGIARVRPAARRPRRVRAARPDRVLHRRRGQAGAVLAPAPRAVGVARRGRDPLRHPARLRPRRGDRLGRARRRRRLRRRRAIAATLRLEGRDYAMADGDVITVKFTP